jgi:DME family drug/metabolite transporter
LAVATTDPAAFGRRCVLAAAVLWSLSGVITKGLDLGPVTIAFYRSLFAGLALLPFVPRGRMRFRPAMLPCGLVFGAMIGLYIAAVQQTTAANAILLQCTATFWLVPASILLLHERPDRRSLAGIGLATVGIAAIVLFSASGRPGEGRGIALGLASGVAYAVVVLGMRGLRGLDPIWLSAVNNLGGALALAGGAGLLIGSWPGRPSAAELAILAVFGVVQMAIPYALFARGLRDIPAPEAGLIGLLEPVLNPIWVLLVHGETPAPATLAGGALLLAGVAVRYFPSRPAARGEG